jgi:hypothetical protein
MDGKLGESLVLFSSFLLPFGELCTQRIQSNVLIADFERLLKRSRFFRRMTQLLKCCILLRGIFLRSNDHRCINGVLLWPNCWRFMNSDCCRICKIGKKSLHKILDMQVTNHTLTLPYVYRLLFSQLPHYFYNISPQYLHC